MRTLHGPYARNNRHLYLAFIEAMNGVDAHAVAIGSRESVNAHLQSPAFDEFLRTRVQFIERSAVPAATGLLGRLARLVVSGGFDVLHLYSLYSYVPIPIDFVRYPALQRIANADLHLLRFADSLARRSTALFFHFQGCDVRQPAAYAGRFEPAETPCAACVKRHDYCGDRYISAREYRLKSLQAMATGTFVSTPDLRQMVGDAEYLPQPFFFDEWMQSADDPHAKYAHPAVVRVAHSPSDARRKGTDAIDAAVGALRDRGLPIEYSRLEGLTRSAMRPTLFGSHVFVDQVLVGYYGNALIEGVAAGALGVVNVKAANDDVLDHVLQATRSSVREVLEGAVERVLANDQSVPRFVDDSMRFFRARHEPAAIFDILQASYRARL